VKIQSVNFAFTGPSFENLLAFEVHNFGPSKTPQLFTRLFHPFLICKQNPSLHRCGRIFCFFVRADQSFESGFTFAGKKMLCTS
jgi:hypothetical protein